MSAENKALLRRWFDDVWNQGREATIDELLAPDAVVHGLGRDMRGPEEFKVFYAAYRNAFPDIAVQIDDVIAEGDIVAARWSARGTHLGDGLGFPATNRAAEFSGMVFVRARNGRLLEGWNSFDQLGMLLQIGAVALPSG
jgi:steroid delta-isomerase-like uncharacterized protein